VCAQAALTRFTYHNHEHGMAIREQIQLTHKFIQNFIAQRTSRLWGDEGFMVGLLA